MVKDLEEVQRILKKYNQEHLLNGFENLDDDKKEALLNQISNIDYNLVQKLYEDVNKKLEIAENEITPIEYIEKDKMNTEKRIEYEKTGEDIIKKGGLAVITMAGGQGTRLGFNGPKGACTIGLKSGKTIFEILIDVLKTAEKKYGSKVHWYLMTSKENNNDTIKFFEENNYWDYGKENVTFFVQGELPMLDKNGKILRTKEGLIKEAADGHGGILEAIYKNNVLEDMQKRNIKWVYIGGVDNILAKMVDPVFIGLAEKGGYYAAGKSLVKAYPEEKVGVFCKKNGKPTVVEYTEITEEMARATDEKGELLYGESHILCNLFSIKAIEKISKNKLPYHTAIKKADYLDENGNYIIAESPNAYKFESFIFDAFETLENMIIMRVKREEEFAPVKNKEGVDSPETARKLYEEYFRI